MTAILNYRFDVTGSYSGFALSVGSERPALEMVLKASLRDAGVIGVKVGKMRSEHLPAKNMTFVRSFDTKLKFPTDREAVEFRLKADPSCIDGFKMSEVA